MPLVQLFCEPFFLKGDLGLSVNLKIHLKQLRLIGTDIGTVIETDIDINIDTVF